MQFETKPLDFLKVVIHQEDLGEDWAAAAADHFCTVHLQTHAFTCMCKYMVLGSRLQSR